MQTSFLPDNVLVPFVRVLAAKRKLRFSRVKLRAHILIIRFANAFYTANCIEQISN